MRIIEKEINKKKLPELFGLCCDPLEALRCWAFVAVVGGLLLVGLGLFGGCGTDSGDAKLSATDMSAAIGDGPFVVPYKIIFNFYFK